MATIFVLLVVVLLDMLLLDVVLQVVGGTAGFGTVMMAMIKFVRVLLNVLQLVVVLL